MKLCAGTTSGDVEKELHGGIPFLTTSIVSAKLHLLSQGLP